MSASSSASTTGSTASFFPFFRFASRTAVGIGIHSGPISNTAAKKRACFSCR
jgi:hypothetical protein